MFSNHVRRYIVSENFELLSLKNDVVFQHLFGEQGNEEITKDFLESITKRKIKSVDLSKNIVLRRENVDSKLGIVDVLVEDENGTQYDIEMQMAYDENIEKRLMYYWSRLYYRQIKKGEDYSQLKKVIMIVICSHELKELKKEANYCNRIYQIVGEHELTQAYEGYIIELPKLNNRTRKSKLKKWLTFLEKPEGEECKKIRKEEKEIAKAWECLEMMSKSEEMQRIAELREKAVKDNASLRKTAIHQGLEQGLEQGLKRGLKKGLKQGMKQGMKQAKIEDAKNMLTLQISEDTIMQITGLSKAEIEQLKAE